MATSTGTVVLADAANYGWPIVSGGAVGSGPAMVTPQQCAMDDSGNRLLVCDRGLAALVAVDLADGARSILSGTGVGSGTAFAAPFDVILDPSANRALVTDPTQAAVIAVDFASGDRTTLSGSGVGTGPALSSDLTQAGTRIYAGSLYVVLASSVETTILGVHLETGDRRIVTTSRGGKGPDISWSVGLGMELGSGLEITFNPMSRAQVLLDLATGDRLLVSR